MFKPEKIFYNKWDGHTYFMHEGLLAACPTNRNGTFDLDQMIYVDDFDIPLSKTCREQIMKKLNLEDQMANVKEQLKVEVVDVREILGDGSLKAFVDVKFADCLIIKGFSVLQGKQGIFVAMPRKAGKDGRWFDILLPVDEAVKHEIEDKVLAAYDKECAI